MKSDRSMQDKVNLKGRHRPSGTQKIHHDGSESPEPSCVSMKSDRSKQDIPNFTDEQNVDEVCSDQSDSDQLHQTDLDSTFQLLEDNINTFVKNELKRFRRVLSTRPGDAIREDEEGG